MVFFEKGFQLGSRHMRHLLFYGADVLVEFHDVFFGCQKFFIYALFGMVSLLLGKVADRFVFGGGDLSAIRGQFPDDDSEQCRFSGAIASYEGGALALVDMERGI